MCKARGMLLIVDEEQTGLGKLGRMFGFETEGIVPDIITLAKHLGGGVGVSALTTTEAIEEQVIASGYAATHSHANDPLICAAGVASLDVMQQRYELIGDVRGQGQLTGIELVRDRHTKQPATDEGREIGRMCFEQGLIFSLRRGGSVLRFVPPATTTPGQIDQAMDQLGQALEAVSTAAA
jgi:2,2-dialkylglycine decarboxylase (pyruvate)